MRQLKLFVTLLLLIAMSGVEATAITIQSWNQDDGVFYLKTNDGLEQYTVDGTITFKCTSSATIPGYRDAGVVFAPAHEGELIQITVNSIDLSGGNYMCVYDGAIEKIGYGVSDGKDQTSYLPAGWIHKLTSDNEGLVYSSKSLDGKLSFGFHSGQPAGQKGFDITVTSLKAKDMEYVSSTAISGKPGIYRGADNQAIFGAQIVTDGGNNALFLNQVSISTAALQGSGQVKNVRLYNGEKFSSDNLLATAATLGEDLTASDIKLKSGNNNLWVVADVMPDATGSIPSLEVTSLTVDGQARTLLSTTSEAVEVGNAVRMQPVNKVYTIGNDVNFYDDGGKVDKISSNFEGSITFVPASERHAIKVDFEKFAIFNTSSVNYNDVFNFYNGREATEENLITTLLKDPKTVKSAAPDGSMTVTLKSTTGVPADGWEAVVSQFLPGDMTFKALNTQSLGTLSASAGDHDVEMLLVDVLTDNQSNPLSLTSITLDAQGTAPMTNLSEVKVYALGENPAVNTTILWGEIQGAASMTINGDYTLAEGHNYFAVLASLSDDASNGDVVKLTITGATVAGENRAPATVAAAEVTIDNVCHISQKAHTHMIHDAWILTDTKSPITPSKYDYVNANHTVTFVPTVENSVIELDFQTFDVYYASSSYGTKATFKVYSGNAASNDNLLWELSSNAQSTTGPGKKLRSTAPNGAMTIVFNPNTTTSYYAGTGFEATVTPFVNHDMTIKEVTARQSSIDIISTGATSASLIDFKVVTEGTLTLKTIKEIKLDLKDSYKVIDKVTVLYSGDKNSPETATEFGSLSEITGNEVTIAGEKDLADGDNYFWVTVDIKNDAETEVAVDAKVVALVDNNGSTTTVTNGDPEGSRLTKSIHIMQDGTALVTVVNPLMFYDNGGPSENFTKGFNGTVTFVPGKENCGVVLDSKSFATGSSTYNKFGVFNGREAIEANRVGTATKYSATNGPVNVLSSAPDGSITVTFTTNSASYASVTAGWEIDVRLHEYMPLTVDSVKTQSVKTTPVVRGSINEPLARVKVGVKDDTGEISLNDFKFATAGTTSLSDIKAARLYYTSDIDDFSTDMLLSETTTVGEEITFAMTEPIKVNARGYYYLWLAVDIDENATAGNKVAAQLLSCSGITDTTTIESPVITRDIKGGFKGTYTVGKSAGAHYATIAQAVGALSQGVEGAVRFEMEDGTYAENIRISAIDGATEQHNITFTSKSGNRDAVVVTGSGTITSTTLDGNAHNEGMVFVDATPYVTFETMSFIPTSQEYPYAVHYYNKSSNFTLRNCVVKATPITSGYTGMNLVYGECTKANGNNNDNVLLENNSLTGGYIGVTAGAYGIVANKQERGLVVRGNTITNCGSKGIYVKDEIGALIENNTVSQSVTSKTSYNGIDIYRNRGQFVVRGNVISNTHSAYSNGLYLRQESTGDDTAPALVYNNVITITQSPNANTAGLQINSDANNVHIVYNTVRVGGDGGYAFYNGGNTCKWTNVKIAGNLFQNATTGNPAALFYSDEVLSKAVINSNAWYSGNGVIVKEYATTIEALNSHTLASDNWEEQAEFLSDTDLHLKSAGTLVAGPAIDYVTTDADGRTRAAVPTVGAYEYNQVLEEKPEVTEGYPMMGVISENSACVKSSWTAGGKLYAMVKTLPVGEASLAPVVAPTAEEMLASQATDYIAGTEAESTFSGLEPSTTHKAYLMVVSALGVASDIVETNAFTTLRHIEPLTLYIEPVTEIINEGASTTVCALVEGGNEPYTWQWRDQMGNEIAETDMTEVTPAHTQAYFVSITSADGQQVSGKTAVIVRGEAVTATFDDYYLPEESYVTPINEDVLYSGSYAFHGNGGSYGAMTYWNGFAFANQTGNTYVNLTPDQYNTSMGGGYNSDGYAIAYPYGTYSIDVTNSEDGDTIQGLYVSNNAYALSSILHGDGFSEAFKQGSWFMLTANGVAADGSSKQVDFYLADYRSLNAADHYALDTWQWMDLRALGKVKSVWFSMSGSDTGSFGLNTPAYFAIDDFNGTRHEVATSVDVNEGTTSIDLSTLFNLEPGQATVTYSLEAGQDSQDVDVTLNGNMLVVDATAPNTERTVVVAATQQGRSQYVSLTIVVGPSTGIEGITTGGNNARKIIENGQVIIIKDGNRYNTLGHKLNE